MLLRVVRIVMDNQYCGDGLLDFWAHGATAGYHGYLYQGSIAISATIFEQWIDTVE